MATRVRVNRLLGADPVKGLADLSTPQNRRLAATNIANVYDATPDHLKAAGRLWYPKVHDATVKGVARRGMTVEQGAGLVAAVSPNMDWDKNNIDAFKELHSLKDQHWEVIHRAAAGDKKAKAAMKPMLQGMGISTAPAANLVKAHRIMQGEPVSDVLPARTAPKTNAFAQNIADPGRRGPVTVDGRAHDIAVNSLRPWTASRGINSAELPSGKPTRYEHFADAYRNAATAVDEAPHDMQAITWVGGKAAERAGKTKSGTPRKVGVRRVGQPYVGAGGLL